LGEVLDPAGAAGGKGHDRTQRQDLQLIDLEVRQFHGRPSRDQAGFESIIVSTSIVRVMA
jgi:hypothetical protein